MITLLGTPHVLFLGSSKVGPDNPNREAPIKSFEAFYDDRVIVGFHVAGTPEEESEFLNGGAPIKKFIATYDDRMVKGFHVVSMYGGSQ